VIHRDVKPSNLILDDQGTVWLTDFGLAKRRDEVTLTLAGAVVGTPRYMSPEQAAALKQPVDHRTDIYSLGATLYELATGQPVFDAETPHAVLSQVLTAEPVPPRRLCPDVPRDLETIILKCLAKEPARRYQATRDLAEDFRSFTQGRTIKARRPSLAEQALRWAKGQRRNINVAALSVLATLVLLVVGLFGWRWYAESRVGQVTFASDDGPATAEVRDDQGEPALATLTLPTHHPVSLPGGWYRVQLSDTGRLSETYDSLVERGVRRDLKAGRSDRLLWEPLAVSKGFDIVEGENGRANVILAANEGLRYIDGATGKVAWQFPKGEAPLVAGKPEPSWLQFSSKAWQGPLNTDLPFGIRPWLVQPTPRPDGGSAPHFVLASRAANALLAMGPGGATNWYFQSEPPPQKEGASKPFLSGVVCPPLSADVDGDGIPDTIAVFSSPLESMAPTWVEAVSGATGRSLWRYVIDPPNAPAALKTGHQEVHFGMGVTGKGDRQVLVVAAGRRLLNLDLGTGRLVGPVRDVGFEPRRSPVFADLTGDGKLALLLLDGDGPKGWAMTAMSPDADLLWTHNVSPTNQSTGGFMWPRGWPVVEDLDGDGKPEILVPFHNPVGPSGWVGVEVLDGATGKSRWQRRLSRASRGLPEPGNVARFAVGPDLDGDGHRDIFFAALVHGVTFDHPASNNVLMLVLGANSGADGRTLWFRQHILGAQVTVRGLHPLRWWQIGADGQPQLVVSFAGGEWDFKQNKLGARDKYTQTLVFAASTGELQHVWPKVETVAVADFNGDGLPDLVGLLPDESGEAGKLLALRGSPPEVWRRLGAWQETLHADDREDRSAPLYCAPSLPQGDLDGDGVGDVLVFQRTDGPELTDEPPLLAYSGKDGRRLWKASGLASTVSNERGIRACHWLDVRDLDGDGRPEVIITYNTGRDDLGTCWLAVLSGRNGAVQWKEKLGSLHYGGFTASYSPMIRFQQPQVADVNGDGILDLLVLAQTEEDNPISAETTRYNPAELPSRRSLRVLDGRTGRVLWKRALPEGSVRPVVAGRMLEGGGVAVALASEDEHWKPTGGGGRMSGEGRMLTGTTVKLHVYHGADGQRAWDWTAPQQERYRTGGLALADLDGDGRESLCFLYSREGPSTVRGRFAFAQVIHGVAIFDDKGHPQQTYEFPRIDTEKSSVAFRTCDLDGDGKDELVIVRDGKLGAYRVGGGQHSVDEARMWEWALPSDSADILEVSVATTKSPATVVIRSGGTVYGVDGPTGRVRWRCEGPGRAVGLAAGRGDLPSILFRDPAKATETICRQALPVGPEGKYGSVAATPITPVAMTPDPWEILPLPWAHQGREHAGAALVPLLLCAGLVLFFVFRRRWGIALGLLLCMILVPLVAGSLDLTDREIRPAAEQRYDPHGWLWLLPCVLSASGSIRLGVLLLVGLVSVLPFLSWKWRLAALGLLLCGPLMWWLSSYGPGEQEPWWLIMWDHPVAVPRGLTLKSPLPWMLAISACIGLRQVIGRWRGGAARS
jgi:hypothetical protein